MAEMGHPGAQALRHFKERFLGPEHPGREAMERYIRRLRKPGTIESTLGPNATAAPPVSKPRGVRVRLGADRADSRAGAEGEKGEFALQRGTEYPYPMDYSQIITIEPGKQSGKPCIRGLRITVSDILEYLASGMSEIEILEDFPELTSEDIRACLAFAADRERRILARVA